MTQFQLTEKFEMQKGKGCGPRQLAGGALIEWQRRKRVCGHKDHKNEEQQP
jgi:hypothetical protein